MNQIRSSQFRKWIMALFLIVGVFPTVQAAFSCEKIDDRVQFSTDCMQMNDFIEPCTDLYDITNDSVSLSENCCDVTHEIIANVKSTTQDSAIKAVLMLDGPQPPPGIISPFYALALNQFTPHKWKLFSKPNHFSSSNTYLITQRIRI